MNRRNIGCPEAEVALLGSFLRLPAARVLEVARRMVVTDLVDPRHRAVFLPVVIVAAEGHDPDRPSCWETCGAAARVVFHRRQAGGGVPRGRLHGGWTRT